MGSPSAPAAGAPAAHPEPQPAPAAPGEAAPGASAAQPAPSQALTDEPKFDFEAMLTRERAVLPRVPVMDPKGRWRGSIEARRPPLVVDRGEHVSIRTSLASKDEVRCEVHEGQLNPGAAVANLIGAASGTITLENAVVYRVGRAGGSPVLFVRARYMTRDTPPLGGELKMAVSPGSQFSFICLHDEPGYRETFVRTVEGLISSFEVAAPDRPPQYSAIWQYQVGEAKTGYSWLRIYADADGTISSYDFHVQLAQLASGEVRIRDYTTAEIHDRIGIRRANYLSYRGTTQAYQIELERSEAGPYIYRGNADGKAVEGRFTPRAPLASEYEVLVRLERARLGATPLQPFRQDEYRPRLDPNHTRSVEYSLDASTGGLQLVEGTNRASWMLADGLPSGSRVTIGPNIFVGTVLEQHSTLGGEPGVTLGAQPTPDAASPSALPERRRNFETHVFAETSHTPAPTPPAGVLAKVTYPAPLGSNVAYVTPNRPGKKRPAVVWIGSGLDWSIGENAWKKTPRETDRSARAFREAGLVTMYPALRGSNENPGKNECFLGEVDDVLAARDFLAAREDVDPERIYLAGHATGGTLALLAAASGSHFAAVFAFGPVSDVRQYGTPGGGGCLPADAVAEEVALRAPGNFVGSIRTPTFVFEGGVGGNADAFDDLRGRASSSVHFVVVPGLNSASILAPGTETIARAILAGRVDDAHLGIGSGRATAPKTSAVK
jgi:acetyl esterase/lipase